MEYQKRDLCENNSSLTNNIITPSCVDGKKEYKVRVTYNHAEKDTLFLCEDCKDRVKEDAESRGYSVEVKKLEE